MLLSCAGETGTGRRFVLNATETKQQLLAQEDTDANEQISIEDTGPKTFRLGSAASDGIYRHTVVGNYLMTTLLQELTLLENYNRATVTLSEEQLLENPVTRLSRMIRDYFWNSLVRRVDEEFIEAITSDPKAQSPSRRFVYVPFDEASAFEYFAEVSRRVKKFELEIVRLPQHITAPFVQSLNHRPGILSLAMAHDKDGRLRGAPFVVPGGRFNEMYGWDSYFSALGLIADGHLHLAKSMVDNFVYEIKHYGKILNANRTYYLCRTQPPFLTSMALAVFDAMERDSSGGNESAGNVAWLKSVLVDGMLKEYFEVWMKEPRLVPHLGLSRYFADGQGVPPEVESGHFDCVLERSAASCGMSVPDFTAAFNEGKIVDPKLSEYFMHDRAVRESGHDTTYRFDNRCANLCTIDLNALLYKYEIDLAMVIRNYCDDCVKYSGNEITSTFFLQAAAKRKALVDQFMWDEERGLFFDYDFTLDELRQYETATCYWAMWSGLASESQANRLVDNLGLFEEEGGLVSGTKRSRGEISVERPERQWDYPYGWAPHQMLAWEGMRRYRFFNEAKRLSYRWLHTILKAFVDHSGIVPEKFNVVTASHKTTVEYGNVGVDFKCIPKEGFGWMNASFQVGLTFLSNREIRLLGVLAPPSLVFPEHRLKTSVY